MQAKVQCVSFDTHKTLSWHTLRVTFYIHAPVMAQAPLSHNLQGHLTVDLRAAVLPVMFLQVIRREFLPPLIKDVFLAARLDEVCAGESCNVVVRGEKCVNAIPYVRKHVFCGKCLTFA